MLHGTPEYRGAKVPVLFSNPAEIVVAEDDSELALPLRGYIAAQHASLELWQRFRQREEFERTKVTGWILFWPQFMEDRKRVNEKGDHFTVLIEWGSRIFFDVHGRGWAFTGSRPVQPRRTVREHPTVICFK